MTHNFMTVPNWSSSAVTHTHTHSPGGSTVELCVCVCVMEEHWSTRVRERALWRDSAGRLPVELSGGSDTGRFTWIRPLASHTYEDVLLEVEDLPVSGRPLCDVLHLLTHCGDPIRIRTVKAGAWGA